MNRERIKDLARFCGFDFHCYWNEDEENQLEVFANLIERAVREQLTEEQANDFKPDYDAIQELLEEINRLLDIIEDLNEQLRNKNDIN
jgi:GAF domain-containing protein